MVSNFARAMASRRELTSTTEVETRHADEGLGERVFGRVRQMMCAMHGHDSLLQFEQDRMFLRCVSCGHESPGWVLDETPPTALAADSDDESQVLSQPELINERRIA